MTTTSTTFTAKAIKNVAHFSSGVVTGCILAIGFISGFILFSLLTGCASATVEDDISIARVFDVGSQYAETKDQIRSQYGQYIPAGLRIPVVLRTSEDVDVSEDLRGFNDVDNGISYGLSNITVAIDCRAPACWYNLGSLAVTLGDITLIDYTLTEADHFGSNLTLPISADVQAVKNLLETGPTSVGIKVSGAITETIDVATTYDVKISMRIKAAVDMSL